MFSKKLAALVATSLVVATSPAIAQADPVTSTRASASMDDVNSMGTPGDGRYAGGFWVAVIGAALLAAFILVILDEEDDLPTSP